MLKSLDWELQSKLDHLSETTLASTSYLLEIFSALEPARTHRWTA